MAVSPPDRPAGNPIDCDVAGEAVGRSGVDTDGPKEEEEDEEEDVAHLVGTVGTRMVVRVVFPFDPLVPRGGSRSDDIPCTVVVVVVFRGVFLGVVSSVSVGGERKGTCTGSIRVPMCASTAPSVRHLPCVIHAIHSSHAARTAFLSNSRTYDGRTSNGVRRAAIVGVHEEEKEEKEEEEEEDAANRALSKS